MKTTPINQPDFEIRLDDQQSLDEVVACHPKFFHLERMDNGAWWMAIETASGELFHINLSAKNSQKTLVEGFAESQGDAGTHRCTLCPKEKPDV